MQLLGPALPEEEGMVRITTSPPTHRSQSELPYHERFFDVPVARTTGCSASEPPPTQLHPLGHSHVSEEIPLAPLVVPLDKPFAASGPGVVAQRTAKKVGFNGFEFRGSAGYPELNDSSSRLVKQAWPPALLRYLTTLPSGEPVYGAESSKCATENWVIRRPVSHFGDKQGRKARYPPRNVLNAMYDEGPRALKVHDALGADKHLPGTNFSNNRMEVFS